MCKLTDIVTSLWLGIGKLDKELFNVIHVFGIIQSHKIGINGCMSVNKLLMLTSYKCMKKGSNRHQWTKDK